MGSKPRNVPPEKKPMRKRPTRRVKPEQIYPSLAQGPTSAERLAQFLENTKANGDRPGQDMGELIEEFRDLWPDDNEIDEFIAWVHRGRRRGWYD
jgi:hypothetical protein